MTTRIEEGQDQCGCLNRKQEEDHLPSPHPDRQAHHEEQLYAVCDRKSAYDLKLILKRSLLFDSKRKVISSSPQIQDSNRQEDDDSYPSIVKIPTNLTSSIGPQVSVSQTQKTSDHKNCLLPIDHPSVLLPSDLIQPLSKFLIGFQWIGDLDRSTSTKKPSASPLSRAIESFFGPKTLKILGPQLPRWELYVDFLLFQPNAFQSKDFLELFDHRTEEASKFFSTVAKHFSVTHIARKGLIDRDDKTRQPKLFPLYGQFRQSNYSIIEDYYEPNDKCFDNTFWTSTRFPTPKGSLTYVWAPSETMYSRGNSSEKLRITNLTNVAGKIVLDMFCGIGFFAFGYLKAGASKVIGCEISPWAVEGLRRGAIKNEISYRIISANSNELNDELLDLFSEQLLIFPACNRLALPIYRNRVTHVNLGLLPSSIEFLPQAVQALHSEGGWLHIHGELAVGGGPMGRQRGAEIWAKELLDQVLSLGRQSVKLITIHWVKSIGPAKEHIVVELEVGPLIPNQA